MAEAAGLAASIVGIAGAGVTVVSTLTKFGISFRGSNEKINSLAGRVSLTASILSDIATTVEQNASGFKKEEFWLTWRKVLLSCEESYGKLDKALLKARRSGATKGENGNDGVSVWGKLVWALGGDTEMQDLENSLERCCQQVMVMQQAVQISVLSLIAQRQKLSSEEIEDQRELMSKLQWLLSTLSEAGALPTVSTKGKSVIVIDEKTPDPPSNLRPKDSSTTEPPRGLDFVDSEKPPMRSKDFGPKSPPTKDLPRSVDFAESHAPPSRSKEFEPNGSGVRFTSFAVNAILPQPKRRRRKEYPTSPTRQSEPKEQESIQEKEYFFEAYYIIPRSVPRAQPRGQIQLTRPVTDDYMIIYLDTKQDYRKDPNLRNALRRAKRARVSFTPSVTDEFPRSVREAALSLASHRKRHANGLTWALVEGVELRCLEESVFRKSSSKSGFLIVFRGSGSPTELGSRGPPLSPSILKGSAHNVPSGEIPRHRHGQFEYPEVSRSIATIGNPGGNERHDNLQNATIKTHGATSDTERPTCVWGSSLTRKPTFDSKVKPPVVENAPGIHRKTYSATIDHDDVRNFAEAEDYTSVGPEKDTASGTQPVLVLGAPEGSKSKSKVKFQNPELQRSERPVSRSLPGPVIYDPARSKLLPGAPVPGSFHKQSTYGKALNSSIPPRPGQPPVVPQSPQSPYRSPPPPLSPYAYSSERRSPAYTMKPAPPRPGWTASSSYSRPVSSDSGLPKAFPGQSSAPHPQAGRQSGPRQGGGKAKKEVKAATWAKWEDDDKGGWKIYDSGRSNSKGGGDQSRVGDDDGDKKNVGNGADGNEPFLEDEWGTSMLTMKKKKNLKFENVDLSFDTGTMPTKTSSSFGAWGSSWNTGATGTWDFSAPVTITTTTADNVNKVEENKGKAKEELTPDAEEPPDDWALSDPLKSKQTRNTSALAEPPKALAEEPIKAKQDIPGLKHTPFESEKWNTSFEVGEKSKGKMETLVLTRSQEDTAGASNLEPGIAGDSMKGKGKIPTQGLLGAAGAAPELQKLSDSREDKEQEPLAASPSIAGAALGIDTVKESKGDKLEKRRRRREEAQNNEIRSRPAVPSALDSHMRKGILRTRPVVTHDDRRRSGIYADPGVDPEEGMIQYGTEPMYTRRTSYWSEESEDRLETRGIPRTRCRRSDSEPSISDFSESGDEESTRVEERKEEKEELHLTQSEAQAMMMNFLATFTTM